MFDFGKILPEEAIAFFVAKLLMSPDEFTLLEDQAKAKAFSITDLANNAELLFLHKSLLEALEEGLGFSAWKQNITELRENNGWTDFRLKTIYQTNMHQAKSIGSWHKMQETKEALPYLKYSAILDDRSRPSHKKMHNIVLPIDDPFWKQFYPPNGFGCRCQAYAVSEYKAKKLGITPKNEKLGFADNGWDNNPALANDSFETLVKDKKKEVKEVKKKIEEKLDS